jgi:polyphosphate kinase 2
MNLRAQADDTAKLKRKAYENQLRKLQAELVELQTWVKQEGMRVVVVFEGRDAAGKGGTIRAITERVSPRVFRVVALPAPSDREKTEMYLQRYVSHLPAAGEIVIFDRSWYNRTGVELVMGFVSPKEHKRFLKGTPVFEKYMVRSGIILLKIWLEVGQKEQQKRFEARINDPLRQWKLSPMDLKSWTRWYDYSHARDKMFAATDTPFAPWYVLRSDNKRAARLNCIRFLLDKIPHKRVHRSKVKLPARSNNGSYNDAASIQRRRFVPEKY